MPGLNIDVSGIGQALGAVGSVAKDIRAAITGQAVLDPAAQAQLEAKLAEIDGQVMTAQAAINQAEAASPDKFISYWRPAVGWACVLALVYEFLARPFLVVAGLNAPELQMQDLIGLLVGMLGLAGARTVEKIRGVEGNR